MKLTKAHLIGAIQSDLGVTRKEAGRIVESLLKTIKTALASNENVLISGFGKFCVKEKRARLGRNPATGEEKLISARRVVTFRCSGKLRERVNGGA